MATWIRGCSDCGSGFVDGKCACAFDTYDEWIAHRAAAVKAFVNAHEGYDFDLLYPTRPEYGWRIAYKSRVEAYSEEMHTTIKSIADAEALVAWWRRNPDADPTAIWLVGATGPSNWKEV